MRGVGLGSAGSVLRSQGTLGQVRRSRCRARGILVSTFLRSLRPDSAAALCYGEWRGFALGIPGVDVPRLVSVRFRCRGHRFVGANFLGQVSGLKTGNDGVSFATPTQPIG